MSRAKLKAKPHALLSPRSKAPQAPPPRPTHRIGDLLWCRENKKRFALWWPAMVTYDPNQAVLARTNARGVSQVHVQYFGISAVRGWVSHLQFEPLVDISSRRLPIAKLGKKMKCEYEIAIEEATEALQLSHKERKLKYIFSFDMSSSPTQQRGRKNSKSQREDMVKIKKEREMEDATFTDDSAEPRCKGLGKRRRGRRNSSNPPRPAKRGRRDNTLSSRVPSRQHEHRNQKKEQGTERDLVVSLNLSGLDTPSHALPTLLVGQSPTTMDSFAVSVDTALNIAVLNNTQKSINGLVVPLASQGHPKKRSSKTSVQRTSARNKRKTGSKRVDSEQSSCVPSTKRLVLDPGSESGSEASGMSITSAILTPPSSGTETVTEEERGGGSTMGEGSVTTEKGGVESEIEGKKTSGEAMGGGGKTKHNVSRRKPSQAVEGPKFRDGDCAICDASDSDLLACQGHCFQAFHVDCLGLIQPPSFQFVCDECQTVSKQCFVCSQSEGVLEVCAKPKCSKFYHRSCIQKNELFVFDGVKNTFTCPLHSCAKCVCNDLDTTVAPKGSALVQCIKCPLALHKPHCLIAGCNMVTGTQMICYLHISIKSELNLYKHLNMDTCLECGHSGSLFCCDFCSSAYHKGCMEEHQLPVEPGEHGDREGRGGEREKERGRGERKGAVSGEKWICPACRDHDLPTYESVVLCKFGVWRWWPGQVVPMTDIPDNIKKKQPGEGMFVIRFCGTRDYCWIHHGRTLSLSLEPGADPAKEVNKMCRSHGRSRANTDKIFKRACEEAMELYSEQMKLQAERKPLPKQDSKAYTKIKINKYLVPRPPVSGDDLHSLPCQCTPESPCDDNSICVNRAIHVECNPKTCPVGGLCQNQKMRRCQPAKTVPFYTGTRGWGLQAATDINEGDFVVEYVGEVLDMKMCHERLQRAHETHTQHFYMLTLDSKNGLVIDAKEKSNHARFINHSCDPNCETQKWTVGHESRVGIFANKFIKAGTELTFDYQLDSLGNGKKECLCGSSNCSGFIGVRSKVEPKAKQPKLKKKPKPASSHKLARPRLPPADTPPVEMTHDNDCFICGDGGDLLCCDFGKCRKVYHLLCLGRKMVPPEKWVCPRHYCTICSKRSFVFCSACPISYCGKHRKDKLVEVNGQQLCDSCCNNTSSRSGKSPDDTATRISIPNSTPIPVSVPTLSDIMSSPPPPVPLPATPPPSLPPPPLPHTLPTSHAPFPSTHPAFPTLPSISAMHPLSPGPFLSHNFASHPLTRQPIHLLMPPSNHQLLYFNSQPFLSSPPSPLIYPSPYHH